MIVITLTDIIGLFIVSLVIAVMLISLVCKTVAKKIEDYKKRRKLRNV